MPGETATLHSWISILENSSEPIERNESGMGAHTNMVPLGFSTDQPILLRPSTRTSRRRRWSSTILPTTDWSPSSATMEAIWIGWKAPEARDDLILAVAWIVRAVPHTNARRQA